MRTIAFHAGEEAEHVANRLESAGYVASLRLGCHGGRYCTTLRWQKRVSTPAGDAHAEIWLRDDGVLGTELQADWLADPVEGLGCGTVEIALDEIARLQALALAEKAAA